VKGLVRCSNDSCTADDRYRSTPLIFAAAKGHEEVVRVLLEGGANTERSAGLKYTALHLAAGYGHQHVCRLLLDWGAKVDSLDYLKYTPRIMRYHSHIRHCGRSPTGGRLNICQW